MKSGKILLVLSSILVQLLCLSCTNIQHDADTQALLVAPLPLQAGKPMRIVYDSGNPYADFSVGDSLYATITMSFRDAYKRVRIMLHRSRGGVYRGTYIVPDNAVNVDVAVGPYGAVQFTEDFTSPVYRGDAPVEYALPHAIRAARSLDQAEALFELDAELYPYTYERYLALWTGLLHSDSYPEEMEEEADHLYTSIVMQEESDFTLMATCALFYSKAGRDKKLSALLERMYASVQNTPKVSLLSSFALGTIWRNLNERLAHIKGPQRGAILNVSQNVLNIAMQIRDLSLLTGILRSSEATADRNHPPEIRKMLQKNQVYKGLLDAAYSMTEDDIVLNGDYLVYLLPLVDERHDDDEYTKLAKNAFPGLNSSLRWLRNDVAGNVSISPWYGLESYIKYNYAARMMYQGKTSEAVPIMTEMMQRNATVELLYAMSFSARDLTRHYIEADQYDSALMYCGYSLVMNSRFADELYGNLRNAYGASVPPKDELAARFYRSNLIQTRTIKPLTIQGEQRQYTLGTRLQDTTYIIFAASKKCSICDVMIPNAIENILGRFERTKILILADIDDTMMQEYHFLPPNSNIDYVRAQQSVLAKLNICSYPSYCVVTGQKIISYGGVSTETHRIIAQALLRDTEEQHL